MLRVKRNRWPSKHLVARWRCPNHPNRPMKFTVLVAMLSDKNPMAGIWGRPDRVLCNCGEEMAYEGLVR